MRALHGLVIVTFALALVDPASVSAQTLEEARTVFEEAERHFENENYGLALRGFSDAHEQLEALGHPRAAAVLFNVGRCYEELRREREAHDAYARMLETVDPSDEMVPQARERLRDVEIRLELASRAETTGEGSGPADAAAPSGSGSDASLIGWIIAGVGGAAALAGVITGAVALDRRATLDDACPGGGCTDSGLAGTIDEARTLGLVTDVLLIAGLSTAALGVVLGLVLGGSDEGPQPSAACTGDGCVLGLRGQF